MGTQPIHDSPCIIHGGPCDHNEAWERLYRSVLQQFRRSQRLLPRGDGGLHRCVLDLMCEESICSSPRSTECSIDLAVEAARGRVDERDLLGAAIGLAYAGLLVFSQDNRNRGKIQAALILDCSAWQPINPAIYAHPAPLRYITLDRFKEWLARRPSSSGEVRDPSDEAKRWTFMRDAFTCAYCGAFCAAPEADQIVPQAVGGSDHPDNLATACVPCNTAKKAKPVTDSLVPAHIRGGR